MKNHQTIGVIVALAVLGNVSAAYAQTAGGFNRVTTVGQNGGAAGQSSRTAMARGSRADSLRPYRARALAESQMKKSQGPRTSSWQQEPMRVQVSRPQPVATAAQSHNYYPTLRASLAVQQPVSLTASSGFIPFQACTGGAALASGLGAHHR